MKIFLDTADVEAVRKAHETGLLDGVTTNPTKISQAGGKFEETIKEICAVTPGPVSAEAMSETADEMIGEAVRLAAIAPNVVVKLPMTAEAMKAIPVLEREKKVRINCTTVFSASQALLAMKAGASFVSIVLSRLDRIGTDSDTLVYDTMVVKQNYAFASEIIAGSVKTHNHLAACMRAGVDIVTVPDSLFWGMFKHPLTDEALAQFARDWESVPK